MQVTPHSWSATPPAVPAARGLLVPSFSRRPVGRPAESLLIGHRPAGSGRQNAAPRAGLVADGRDGQRPAARGRPRPVSPPCPPTPPARRPAPPPASGSSWVAGP